MAEGWARQLKSAEIEAFSAGTETHGLNPNAVAVMAEAGVDISGHVSKTLVDLGDIELDCVVTVCSDADANCPVFPGAVKKIHHGFDDPPRLAKADGPGADPLVHYRRVRDEIKQFVMSLPESLA